jgi:hypothetical protein
VSEEIRILVPKPIADAIRRVAERRKLTVEQVILRAIVLILEGRCE